MVLAAAAPAPLDIAVDLGAAYRCRVGSLPGSCTILKLIRPALTCGVEGHGPSVCLGQRPVANHSKFGGALVNALIKMWRESQTRENPSHQTNPEVNRLRGGGTKEGNEGIRDEKGRESIVGGWEGGKLSSPPQRRRLGV